MTTIASFSLLRPEPPAASPRARLPQGEKNAQTQDNAPQAQDGSPQAQDDAPQAQDGSPQAQDDAAEAQDDAAKVVQAALEQGFSSIGFTPATPLPQDSQALQRWLQAGYHGDMQFMAQHPQRDRPATILPEACSVIVVALPYARQAPQDNTADSAEDLASNLVSGLPLDPLPDSSPVSTQGSTLDSSPGSTQGGLPAATPRGIIARYARGADYHQVLRHKLYALATQCQRIFGEGTLCRPCVDSAPLLERGYAARAGVGFAGKNTLTLIPGVGSYVLLGELLINRVLRPGAAATSRCGSCTACLRACPTGAFVQPHVLDARRCISYLTIELKGAIPRHLRAAMGNLIFGCDICQQVCPFNASARPRPGDPSLAPLAHLQAPALIDVLRLGAAQHRRFVRGTSLRRASRAMLQRNAAVALGNSGCPTAVAPLAEALAHSIYPLVRSHAAWALGQLGAHEELRQALQQLGARGVLPQAEGQPPTVKAPDERSGELSPGDARQQALDPQADAAVREEVEAAYAVALDTPGPKGPGFLGSI
jgi:epoxyqueuosine reductase